jgi:5,6-dimethylbenzimidazole synthase
VSIIDPVQVRTILDVSSSWHLIAYLCMGYPEQETDVPELEQERWAKRKHFEEVHLQR